MVCHAYVKASAATKEKECHADVADTSSFAFRPFFSRHPSKAKNLIQTHKKRQSHLLASVLWSNKLITRNTNVRIVHRKMLSLTASNLRRRAALAVATRNAAAASASAATTATTVTTTPSSRPLSSEAQAPSSFSHEKMASDKRYQPTTEVPESLMMNSEADGDNPFSIRGEFRDGRAAYLDMSATTPLDPRVLDAMAPYMVSFKSSLPFSFTSWIASSVPWSMMAWPKESVFGYVHLFLGLLPREQILLLTTESFFVYSFSSIENM